jgi:isoamylase
VTGSSDIFEQRGRRPSASINFITAHDGFTLQDLVSYNDKHNEANGEENHDGHDHNVSWNCGAEGATEDAAIIALRDRQKRNFLATLLLSLGVPMLLAGDESGRSQGGNNNAYCQDNDISWTEWADIRPEDGRLREFVRALITLRRTHPIFQRPHFLRGEATPASGLKDITWLTPGGTEPTAEDWSNADALCIGYVLGGMAGRYLTLDGRPANDNSFLVMLNAYHEDLEFHLPALPVEMSWSRLVDTAEPSGLVTADRVWHSGDTFPLKARSFVLFIDATTPDPGHG